MTQDDPRLILQDLLDAMSLAARSDDYDAVLSYYSLPYLHRALDSKVMLETREDLRIGVEAFYKALVAKGADQIIRLASNATYLSPNYIEGVYVTHLLVNSVPVTRSFTNRTIIRRTPDGWKLAETFNGFSHKIWPIRVFYVPDEPLSYPDASEDDARRSAMEPLAIYQSFINAMTRTNVSGDFEAYCKHCMFPHTIHANNHDGINETPEAAREFFFSLLDILVEHDIQDFVRIADYAEFVSADEICGYHMAHFLRDGQSGLPPVRSRMILKRSGTQWYMSSVTNSLENEEYPYRHLVPASELVTQLAIQKRTKQ